MVYADVDTPYVTVNNDYGGYRVFRCNSIFDVNGASLSRTMVGVKEWANFYSRYRVMGCKISCTFTNQGANGDFICFIHFARNANTPWSSWVEAVSTVSGNYGGISKVLGPADGNRGVIKLSKYVKLGRIWGDPLEYNASTFFAAMMGENPNQVLLGRVGILSTVGAAFSATVVLRTKITMYVKLFNKKILFQTLMQENDNDGNALEGDDTINDPV